MTENVREEMLKDIRDGYIDEWDNLTIDELFKAIEKEHEEIQAYRAIGTVEEIQQKLAELEQFRAIGRTPSQIYINTGGYIAELAKYAEVGTVEEFKALKEKAEAHDRELRNKAIDEFTVKLKNFMRSQIEDAEYFGDACCEIYESEVDEIAEQMKGGRR